MAVTKQTPTPAGPGAEPIIGIDLGTTNSLVAWCDATGPRCLPDEQGRNLLPSVVRFCPDTGAVLAIGHEARAHAVEFPRDTVFSIKRLMGRGIADVQDELAYLPYEVVAGENNTARVRIGARIISPQEVSAVILRELKRRAEAFFGRAVRKAVITVPAYFDDAQRQATRDAGRLAGLDVVRVVNEPTASSLAYHLGLSRGRTRGGAAGPAPSTVAVFDLGGGTFDFSILRLEHTEAAGVVDQVLATAGDTHLGGDDIDRMIVELAQREIRTAGLVAAPDAARPVTFPPATRQAFRDLAEAAKIRLSSEQTTTLEIDLKPEGRTEERGSVPDRGADTAAGDRPRGTYRRTLTRDELEAMIAPWLQRALDCCGRALRTAGLAPADLERVILVGGSTRLPPVRRRVAELFGQEPYTALNPDEVVALGAAVQAAILAGVHRDLLLLDVIPLSLGIETLGGAVAKLIVANSTIPAKATEMFTTFAEGQTSVAIHVLQGERELVQDCRSLGRFELRGVPPMPAGLPQIEVTFLVDANGILNVTAVEKRSERAASIQIVPNHGLSRQEIERIERESFQHARADMTAHRVIDLKNQSRMDVRAIERQLAKVGDEVEPDYKARILEKVEVVKAFAAADSPDADAFAKALTDMDHASVRLAELAIRKTLRDDGLKS